MMGDDAAGVALIASIWLLMFMLDRVIAPYSSVGAAFLAVAYLGLTAWEALHGSIALASMDAAVTGWLAYLAWNRRKPRQRKPSKVAAKVRDLGHRLVVVPS
jgi:hypothetical protein